MTRFLRCGWAVVVGGTFALVSCQGERNQHQVPGKVSSTSDKQEIFGRNREFVYRVSRVEGNQAVVVDTVVLTSTGTVWKMDSAQKGIGWSSIVSGVKSSTGVEETPSGVWIHPPRFDAYAILELSPFPEIRLPYKAGQEWDWELDVGPQWGNPAWVQWEGRMTVRTHYTSIGEQLVATALGELRCQKVTAVATCTEGKADLALLFHPQYGFVELDYVNINRKQLRFQLLSVGIMNQFDGAAYFGKQ